MFLNRVIVVFNSSTHIVFFCFGRKHVCSLIHRQTHFRLDNSFSYIYTQQSHRDYVITYRVFFRFILIIQRFFSFHYFRKLYRHSLSTVSRSGDIEWAQKKSQNWETVQQTFILTDCESHWIDLEGLCLEDYRCSAHWNCNWTIFNSRRYAMRVIRAPCKYQDGQNPRWPPVQQVQHMYNNFTWQFHPSQESLSVSSMFYFVQLILLAVSLKQQKGHCAFFDEQVAYLVKPILTVSQVTLLKMKESWFASRIFFLSEYFFLHSSRITANSQNG